MSEILREEPDAAATTKLVMYGHAGCPMVPPVLATLRAAKVDYDYVNIRQDEAGRDRVREINHGNESVPTLVFPDGSTLTEPSAGALRAKLRALGYEVPLITVIMGNIHWIVIALGVLWAVLTALGVI